MGGVEVVVSAFGKRVARKCKWAMVNAQNSSADLDLGAAPAKVPRMRIDDLLPPALPCTLSATTASNGFDAPFEHGWGRQCVTCRRRPPSTAG